MQTTTLMAINQILIKTKLNLITIKTKRLWPLIWASIHIKNYNSSNKKETPYGFIAR